MKEPLQSDTPSAGDELKRRPFAARIVQALSVRDPGASVVVGVHAPAGDGKTTVLQFVEEAFASDPSFVCINFNPWQIELASELPRALLMTLADAVGSRLSPPLPLVQAALRKYAEFFQPPGGAANATADSSAELWSAVHMGAAKAAVDRALSESGRSIVVLIDDVDHLDAAHLQALFKLLKVTADFPGVSYVLAGDDSVIADRLSVALGRVDAGREFLERTIQVPLSVPKANPELLREFFLRRLKASLDPSIISVRPDAEARFSEMYLQGLQQRIKSPRTAKRFINALNFALGMVKSRVNTVDLIVIEGIRLLYPNLYRAMRDNRDDFLWYRISRDGPDADNRANELMQMAAMGLRGPEQEAVHFLVRSLFPAFDRTRYPSRGDTERWGDDKRICSPEHFDRFFDYNGA